jgi:hypothetical protein
MSRLTQLSGTNANKSVNIVNLLSDLGIAITKSLNGGLMLTTNMNAADRNMLATTDFSNLDIDATLSAFESENLRVEDGTVQGEMVLARPTTRRPVEFTFADTNGEAVQASRFNVTGEMDLTPEAITRIGFDVNDLTYFDLSNINMHELSMLLVNVMKLSRAGRKISENTAKILSIALAHISASKTKSQELDKMLKIIGTDRVRAKATTAEIQDVSNALNLVRQVATAGFKTIAAIGILDEASVQTFLMEAFATNAYNARQEKAKRMAAAGRSNIAALDIVEREVGKGAAITETPATAGAIGLRSAVNSAMADASLSLGDLLEQTKAKLASGMSILSDNSMNDAIVIDADLIDINSAQSVNDFRQLVATLSASGKNVFVAGMVSTNDRVRSLVKNTAGVNDSIIDITNPGSNALEMAYGQMELSYGAGTIGKVTGFTRSFSNHFACNAPWADVIIMGDKGFDFALGAYVTAITRGTSSYVTFTDTAIARLREERKRSRERGDSNAKIFQLGQTSRDNTEDSVNESLFADMASEVAF